MNVRTSQVTVPKKPTPVIDLLQTKSVSRMHQYAKTDPELVSQNSFLREEIASLRQRILELERMADMDPLLSIYNGRAFVKEIERAKSVQDRFGLKSSVIFFDLNDFKEVNDTYGHGVGDDVLKAVAQTLLSGVRNCDMVARLGGDEFGILLFKSEVDVATAKAATLSCRVNDLKVAVPDGCVQITTSWGVANCDPEKSTQSILDHADREMYRRKRRGPKRI